MSSPIKEPEPKLVSLDEGFSTQFRLLSDQEVCDRDRAFAHTKLHTMGAIYDKNGRILFMSTRVGGVGGDKVTSVDPLMVGSATRETAALSRISGTTIYLGNFMSHYGHFITESMSRMWSLFSVESHFDHYAYFPFVFDGGEIVLSDFHKYFFELLQVPLNKLLFLSDPVIFDRVVVPQAAWVINRFCLPQSLRPMYGAIRKKHEGDAGFDRIFLSRFPRPGLRFTDTAAVEALFASHGFEILFPESMEIAEQLRAYANCRVMAGFSGTALHNCVFAREGTCVIELCDPRWPDGPIAMQMTCNGLAGVLGTHIPYAPSPTLDGKVDIARIEAELIAILGRIGV